MSILRASNEIFCNPVCCSTLEGTCLKSRTSGAGLMISVDGSIRPSGSENFSRDMSSALEGFVADRSFFGKRRVRVGLLRILS